MTIDNPNTPWENSSQTSLTTASPFGDGSLQQSTGFQPTATEPQWRANYNQVSPLFPGAYGGSSEVSGNPSTTQTTGGFESNGFPGGTQTTGGFESNGFPGTTQTTGGYESNGYPGSTADSPQGRANYNQVAPEFPNGGSTSGQIGTPYTPGQYYNPSSTGDTGQYGTPPDVNQTPIVVAPQSPSGDYPTQPSSGNGTGTPEKQMPTGSSGGQSPNFQPGTGDTGGQANQSPSDTGNGGSKSNTPTPSWSQIPNSSGDGGFVSDPPPPQPSESPYNSFIAGGIGGIGGQYLIRGSYRVNTWIQAPGGGNLRTLLSPMAGEVNGAIERTPPYQKQQMLRNNITDLANVDGHLQDQRDLYTHLSKRQQVLSLDKKSLREAKITELTVPGEPPLFSPAEEAIVRAKRVPAALQAMRDVNTPALAEAQDRLGSLERVNLALEQRQSVLTGESDTTAARASTRLNPELLRNRSANQWIGDNINQLDPRAVAGFGRPLPPGPGDAPLVNNGRVVVGDMDNLRAIGVSADTIGRLEGATPPPLIGDLGAPFQRRVPTALRNFGEGRNILTGRIATANQTSDFLESGGTVLASTGAAWAVDKVAGGSNMLHAANYALPLEYAAFGATRQGAIAAGVTLVAQYGLDKIIPASDSAWVNNTFRWTGADSLLTGAAFAATNGMSARARFTTVTAAMLLGRMSNVNWEVAAGATGVAAIATVAMTRGNPEARATLLVGEGLAFGASRLIHMINS